MKNSADIIADNLSNIREIINPIAKNEAQAISASFSSINDFSPELLKNKTADSQKRIIKKILNTDFINKISSRETLSEKQIQIIKYNFRHIISPLNIPFPIPIKQLRSLAMPILALSGAVIGILAGGLIFRASLGNDYRQFGIIIGAAAGSFLCTFLGVYLSKHAVMLRILQGLFGAAIAAEIITLFTGAINPISSLWRKLTGHFGGGIWGKIKRVGAFALGILILQIAVPEKKIPQAQLEANAYSSIKSWVELSVKLLILIIGETSESTENINEEKSDKTDIQLLRSLVKLANHKNSKEAELISHEIILAFKNAGYEIKSKEAENYPAYSENLKKEFDIEGYINEKDPYKIFEMPLYKNDKLVIRGKLTKKR